jgi:hypothetical protein
VPITDDAQWPLGDAKCDPRPESDALSSSVAVQEHLEFWAAGDDGDGLVSQAATKLHLGSAPRVGLSHEVL